MNIGEQALELEERFGYTGANGGLYTHKFSRMDAATLIHLGDRIGRIFDPLNRTMCPNCKAWASSEPAKEWDKKHEYIRGEGCCSSCAHNNGYFYELKWSSPLTQENMKKMQKLYGWDCRVYQRIGRYVYHHGYGFFDPIEHRCKLPRALRSLTCMCYRCMDMNAKLTEKQKAEIKYITHAMAIIKQRAEIPT